MRDQRLWTWHIAAGTLVLVLLGLHMAIMHLDAPSGLATLNSAKPTDWANVAARARSGFFMVTYILLLGAALFHGFYGLRTIVFELNPAPAVKRGVSAVLTVAGVVLFAFGAFVAWAAWSGFTLGA